MSKKAYWIIRVDVSDPDGYKKYLAANPAAAFSRRDGPPFLFSSRRLACSFRKRSLSMTSS